MVEYLTIRLPFPSLYGNCGNINICYRTFGLVTKTEQTSFFVRTLQLFCEIAQALRDTLKGVRVYLSARVDFEPNPYYKGRYQVALSTCVNAWNNLSHPYEVAEVLFRGSRFAAKINRWLVERCERFPYLHINFDGSLGDWKEPSASLAAVDRASLPPKKPVQSVKLDVEPVRISYDKVPK